MNYKISEYLTRSFLDAYKYFQIKCTKVVRHQTLENRRKKFTYLAGFFGRVLVFPVTKK